jgi:hypothetical protein
MMTNGQPKRPATLIDDTVVFSDGFVRKLTFWERVKLRFGLLTTVKRCP